MNNSIQSFEGNLSTDYYCKIQLCRPRQIFAKISKEKNCCEQFGIIIMQNKKNVQNRLDDFLEKEITNVDIIVNFDLNNPKEIICNKIFNEANKRVTFEYPTHIKRGSQIIVRCTIKDEEFPLDIILFNEHNGYYPHDISLYFCLNINGYILIQNIVSSL